MNGLNVASSVVNAVPLPVTSLPISLCVAEIVPVAVAYGEPPIAKYASEALCFSLATKAPALLSNSMNPVSLFDNPLKSKLD